MEWTVPLGEINWNFTSYWIWKFIHVCAVIVWTGSTFAGTWYVLCARKYSRQKGEEFSELELWVRKRFIFLVNVEHIAFAILVPVALVMAWQYWNGFFSVFFIQWKFWIAITLLVPMEIADIVLTNFILSPALKAEPLDLDRLRRAIKLHDGFYFAMTFLLAVVFPIMFYLAIFKPTSY